MSLLDDCPECVALCWQPDGCPRCGGTGIITIPAPSTPEPEETPTDG